MEIKGKISLIIVLNLFLLTSGQGNGESSIQQIEQILDSANILITNSTGKAKELSVKALSLSKQANYKLGIIESQTILGYIFKIQSKYDSSIICLKIAEKTARSLNDEFRIVNALIGQGATYSATGDWKLAIESLNQGLSLINLTSGDKSQYAKIHNNLGNIYLDQSQFQEAIEHYQLCMDVLSGTDRLEIVASLNLGLVYFRLDEFKKAEEIFLQAISLAEKADDKESIAEGYQKMGILSRKLGNYDKAMEYYNNSINFFGKVGNQKMVAQINTNIGNIYFEKQEFTTAIDLYKESLRIQEKIDDLVSMCYTMSAIGQAYFMLNEFEKSEFFLMKTKKLSENTQVPLITMDVHLLLSELYSKKRVFEKAYYHYQKSDAIKDSIFKDNEGRLLSEMKAKYEVAQKEKVIELLNAESEIKELKLQQRQNERNILFLAVCLVLLLISVLFYRYRSKVKANEKLKELDEMKTRFFENITHEFRTPLSLILGPIQKNLEHENNEETRTDLNRIQRNVERLLNLIDQLLELTRLEEGRVELNITTVDLLLFVTQIVAEYRSPAKSRNIRLEIAPCEYEVFVNIDVQQFRKVISNLLSNAFKFTPDGGSILVSTYSDGKQSFVSVKDNGIGIAKNQQKQIFKRYYTGSDSVTSERGTGIGLAMIKEIISQHGGNINVESELNHGSNFMVSIPASIKINDKEGKTYNSGETKRYADNSAHDRRKNIKYEGTVLVVEDDPDMSDYIRSILSVNYKIIIAKNGKEGIKRAVKTVPDIIITDVLMPELNGMELSKFLKDDEKTSHIPIIMLTAKTSMNSKIEGLSIGVDDYLPKPFNSHELIARVHNLIVQRSKLRILFGKTLSLEPDNIQLSSPDAEFIKKVVNIVDENISNQDFTSEKFQQEIAMSRMQLHRKLKALTGYSTSEFIRIQRLKRAKSMLSTKGVFISEVAYQCGFNNLSYFSKCFKELFGENPSDYQEKKVD